MRETSRSPRFLLPREASLHGRNDISLEVRRRCAAGQQRHHHHLLLLLLLLLLLFLLLHHHHHHDHHEPPGWLALRRRPCSWETSSFVHEPSGLEPGSSRAGSSPSSPGVPRARVRSSLLAARGSGRLEGLGGRRRSVGTVVVPRVQLHTEQEKIFTGVVDTWRVGVNQEYLYSSVLAMTGS